MKKIFGQNWKTTLAGVGAAAGYAALTAMSGGAVAAKDILIAAGIAVLGYLSKDAGVTGTGK